MADVFVVVTVLAFFALCVALVWGCDRIIGPDDPDAFGEPDADGATNGVTAEVIG